MTGMTRGLFFVHSTPSALCPHIEWAVEGVLGVPPHFDWSPQPAMPGSVRCEVPWTGPEGTGARLASAFLAWQRIRFEVTEDSGPAGEGNRWSYTPNLGIFHAATTISGDITVPEERIKLAISQDATGAKPLRASLDELLGTPWDDELEVFRHAGEDAPVRWMHRAG
ncbi:uncharacterized protein DUF3145 [Luteococcus japonicus]|uniref:DUF3145 domain-containing protein n=2 Tax=Luteococcus japonicus TaxID=33984 RepID=A0A1R4K5T9_9ACTN|nr:MULTISPECIES: DUF3145 domain-containing protein [Luteococcus]MDN5562515.1 DUF3145 domain-containing protein [Luteococcus sp.]ROR53234.1 uncharacterized protein DUF3145 [Luteococcus japonicus]SJN39730.1 hypothetical protein FM114_11705 [Luteococcus japonicus LSP_Lj1]